MTKPVDPAAFAGDLPATDADLAGEAHTTSAAPQEEPKEKRGIPFAAVKLRLRKNGWSAWRQRVFIDSLATTGCVAQACEDAGVTPRSAYRLRQRPGAESFAQAWDHARTIGLSKLVDIAVDRAIHGTPRGVWSGGRRIGEEYVPSDRLLMFLLAHHQPTRYGKLSGLLPVKLPDPIAAAQDALPVHRDALVDFAAPGQGDGPADHHECFQTLWDEPDLSEQAEAELEAETQAKAAATRPPA